MFKKYYVVLRNDEKTKTVRLPHKFWTMSSAERFINKIDPLETDLIEGVIYDEMSKKHRRILNMVIFTFCFLIFCLSFVLAYDIILDFIVFLIERGMK